MKIILHNQKIKHFSIIFILLCMFVLISALSYVDAVSKDISNSVLRLHVIANSDSVDDQNLKYKVRDAILEYMNSISNNCSNKSDAIELANLHKDDFYKIAKKTILDNGYNYDININVGNFYFPTKQYGDITLPCGHYDALRIEIGNANGKNWWCVMFPPLCFVDVSSGIVSSESKELIHESLSDEEFDIISNPNNTSIKFKFGIIEMFQNLKIANK